MSKRANIGRPQGTSPREGCGLHSSRAAPSFRGAHNLPGILIVTQAEGWLSPNSAGSFRSLHRTCKARGRMTSTNLSN